VGRLEHQESMKNEVKQAAELYLNLFASRG